MRPMRSAATSKRNSDLFRSRVSALNSEGSTIRANAPSSPRSGRTAGSERTSRYHGASGIGDPSRSRRSENVAAGTKPRTAGSRVPTPLACEKTFFESPIRTRVRKRPRAQAAATTSGPSFGPYPTSSIPTVSVTASPYPPARLTSINRASTIRRDEVHQNARRGERLRLRRRVPREDRRSGQALDRGERPPHGDRLRRPHPDRALQGGRLPDDHVQRRRLRRLDVRQWDPVYRQVRLRPRPHQEEVDHRRDEKRHRLAR